MNNMKKTLVFIIASVILLALLTGCQRFITNEEWEGAEMICRSHGKNISHYHTNPGGVNYVLCDKETFAITTEEMYNAMIVLSKKGEL